jgi:transposase
MIILDHYYGMEAIMRKKYIVELTSEERDRLKAVINADRMAAHKRKHAQMLLKADQGPQGSGWSDIKIAEAFDCHRTTVENLRKRLVEHGLDKAMGHGNRGSYRAKKFDGVAEAHLIATACSSPPEGFKRWTVRLLADEMVSLGVVNSCGKTTVHETLKKMNLSLT